MKVNQRCCLRLRSGNDTDFLVGEGSHRCRTPPKRKAKTFSIKALHI